MEHLPLKVRLGAADHLHDVFTHRELDLVMKDAGAPGEPDDDWSKRDKIVEWLGLANGSPSANAVAILAALLDYLETRDPASMLDTMYGSGGSVARTRALLATVGLQYANGKITTSAPLGPGTNRLKTVLDARNQASVEAEYERAERQVHSDPEAAILAACAVLEAVLKTYIDDHAHLARGEADDIRRLWKTVRENLGLDPKVQGDKDVKEILQSLAGLVNGIGNLRSHTSSAHGRGRLRYQVQPRHAALAVGAAHTITAFILETWQPA